MADDPAQQVLAKFPQYGFMLADPELRYLLIANLNPSGQFKSAEYQAELLTTNWWKTHSESQKLWIQTVAMDPATADHLLNQKIDQMRNFAQEGGLALTEPELRWEATLAIGNGWSDQEAKRNLIWVAGTTGRSGRYSGSIGAATQQVRSLASDMAVPITEEEANTIGNNIWLGQNSLDATKVNLAQKAIAAYGYANPMLAQALNTGQTVRQFMDPQIAAVANELEMSANQINLTDPRWTPLLNYQDPGQGTPTNTNRGSGAPRIMTVPEAQRWARSQMDYRFTQGARQKAFDTTLKLEQLMGKVG